MEDFSYERLPKEVKMQFAKARQDAQYFTETFLKSPNPTTPDGKFVANYPQKRIFKSKKLSTWVCVHRRAGKMQPLYELVMTPEGPVAMGSVSVGQKVCTPDGQTAKITKIHVGGKSQVYRVYLSDGTYCDAHADHDWKVYTDDFPSLGVILTSKELKNADPSTYFLEHIAPCVHTSKVKGLYGGSLEEIPEEYVLGTLRQRIHLLNRLIKEYWRQASSDGLCSISLPSIITTRQTVSIARSLGCFVHQNGNNIDIFVPKNLTELAAPGSSDKALRRYITKVEVLKNSVDMQCITIDHPSHLYITSNYTPTHNCLTEDNYVIDTETLRPKRLSDAQNDTHTWTFDFSENKVIPTKCEWIDSGKKTCVKLSLGSGVSLSLSTDHRLFDAKRGWVETGTLKVGDRILAPSILPSGTEESGIGNCAVLAKLTVKSDYIPDEAFLLNYDSNLRFLKELFEVYGKVVSKGRCEYRFLKKDLAFDAQHLLLRAGIDSRVDGNGILNIENPVDLNTFLVKVLKLKIPLLDVRSTRRWDIIVDIKQLGSRKVYDLSVDHQDFNFIANNTVVHNSFSFTALALWHAITQEDKKIIVFFPTSKQATEFFDTLDRWIDTNELLLAYKAPVGNTKDPPIRTFVTGSTITGQILSGSTLRGLTADVVFVDEAQELTDKDWSVIDPIIIGDYTRIGKIRTYYAGTLYAPEGKYFETIRKFRAGEGKPPDSEIIFIPVTENPDITEENLEFLKGIVQPGTWRTEYLLEVGDGETSVFSVETVNKAFERDWEPGPHRIHHNKVRFLSIDWDKYQCGTNILVTQYDPLTKQVELLHQEEVNDPVLTYTKAVSRALELWQNYSCRLMIVDKGAGEGQIENLMVAAMENPTLGLMDNLIPVSYRQNVVYPDPSTGEPMKENIKSFLVGRLKQKLQNNELIIPLHRNDIYKQFIGFKVVKVTDNTITYTDKNEHIIDNFLLSLYGIWTLFENEFENNNSEPISSEIRRLPRNYQQEQPEAGADIVFPVRSNIDYGRRSSF